MKPSPLNLGGISVKMEETFLFCSIQNAGKQRIFSLNSLYFFVTAGISCIFLWIFLQELVMGFPSGWVVALAVVFALAAGLLSYHIFCYLRYGYRIYRHPEQAQFLKLFEGDKEFQALCEEVEAEKGTSLVKGIPHVTVTPSFLYVQQQGYFELYRHRHIANLSFQNGSGRMLCFTDTQGNDRELARRWDDQVIPQFMRILGIDAKGI